VRIEQSGTAVVPAQRLSAICRELPHGPVRFAWDAERRESRIEGGGARFELMGQSPEDFPEIPEVGGVVGVEVDRAVLHDMIRRVSFAAAKERMRYALNGVLIKAHGERIEMVATDGRRLAYMSAACSNPDDVVIEEAIVPTKGLLQLDKALSTGSGPVSLSVGNNHFGGRTAEVTVVSRLVEGKFPPYADVIPKDCTCRAVIDRDALQSALKRCALITTRGAQSVRMQFSDGSLTLSARSSEGSAEETLACDFTADDQVIGFNPEFFLEAIPVLSGESAVFEWSGKATPGKITEGDYAYVVMPVSLE
jgi:DNA polymerase-3 subunit beta